MSSPRRYTRGSPTDHNMRAGEVKEANLNCIRFHNDLSTPVGFGANFRSLCVTHDPLLPLSLRFPHGRAHLGRVQSAPALRPPRARIVLGVRLGQRRHALWPMRSPSQANYSLQAPLGDRKRRRGRASVAARNSPRACGSTSRSRSTLDTEGPKHRLPGWSHPHLRGSDRTRQMVGSVPPRSRSYPFPEATAQHVVCEV